MAATDFAPWFADWTEPWYFADVETTLERLNRAGFRDARVWKEEAPTPFPSAGEFAEFLRTVVLRDHLARLPDEPLRARYLDALVREAARDEPPFTLDYWRLNLEATRPS
jgi:hypothetical protein